VAFELAPTFKPVVTCDYKLGLGKLEGLGEGEFCELGEGFCVSVAKGQKQ
jgi:hypothetical protein